MKPKKRQKLCHHCEAQVDLDVIVCPYCAADLREEKPEQHVAQGRFVAPLHADRSAEQSLYPSNERNQESRPAVEKVVHRLPSAMDEEESAIAKSPWLSLALCTLGAQLLLLGVLMVLFSEGGALVLRWNAKWWLMYLLGAGPCLFFGVRALKGG